MLLTSKRKMTKIISNIAKFKKKMWEGQLISKTADSLSARSLSEAGRWLLSEDLECLPKAKELYRAKVKTARFPG